MNKTSKDTVLTPKLLALLKKKHGLKKSEDEDCFIHVEGKQSELQAEPAPKEESICFADMVYVPDPPAPKPYQPTWNEIQNQKISDLIAPITFTPLAQAIYQRIPLDPAYHRLWERDCCKGLSQGLRMIFWKIPTPPEQKTRIALTDESGRKRLRVLNERNMGRYADELERLSPLGQGVDLVYPDVIRHGVANHDYDDDPSDSRFIEYHDCRNLTWGGYLIALLNAYAASGCGLPQPVTIMEPEMLIAVWDTAKAWWSMEIHRPGECEHDCDWPIDEKE